VSERHACPSCNKALPPSVVSGPAQAVVRCEGCQTLLLWSNGRVMRSAKSSTPTIMGMPAVGVKPAAPAARDDEAPLPELKPEGDGAAQPAKASAAKPAAPKTPPPRPAPARRDPTPATAQRAAPSGPIKTAPSAPMKNAPSAPMKNAPSGPIKTAPSGPIKTAPSGPVKLPPPAAAAKPAATAAKPDAGKGEAPHVVVAAVAQVPKMGSGDMVDPSAWFAGGDVSDVVPPEKLPPIEATKMPQGETTGAQPLPPPPALLPLEAEPFEIEAPGEGATPATGMPALRSGPIAINESREPSQKVATPPPATPPKKATEPAKRPTEPAKKPTEPGPRATVMGRPALEVPKPAEPVAAAIDLLPPAKPATAPPKTPVPSTTAAANAPAATVEREVSAETLPPPPSPSHAVAEEATKETALPAQPQAMLPLPETTRVPREIPRRLLFIVGGAAAGVILLVMIALSLLRGPKPAARPIAHAATAPAPAPAAAAVAPAPTPPPPEAPPPPQPAAPEPTEAAAPAPPRPRHTLGGKKVVLEYDPKPTSPAPPPPQAPTPTGEDPATVARAREAYHKGNVKLFAGDDDGAIALYREALKIYPGYVAGYRGLGLAFEEAGKKSDALAAFHTYVRTVPNAVDAAIIRRRIEHLESTK